MLAAYIHHFNQKQKKKCGFNSDTAATGISVKGLKESHDIAEKVYEKDPRLLT